MLPDNYETKIPASEPYTGVRSSSHVVCVLDRTVNTVRLMAKRGDLEVDPETDSSDAVFVTRASLERCVDSSKRELEQTVLPLAELVRFTGRSRIELLDLVRGGVLDEVPGRGACKLTASSLRSRMTASALILTTMTSRNALATSTVGSPRRLGPSGLLSL